MNKSYDDSKFSHGYFPHSDRTPKTTYMPLASKGPEMLFVGFQSI